MSDNLVKRLRDRMQHSEEDCYKAADRIEGLEARLAKVDAHRATLARAIKNQRKEIKSIQYHVRCLKSILKGLKGKKNE
jgi:uncharacterized coiled-coil protein SlyX